MQEFTNDPIDIEALPNYEQAQLKTLHPKYWNVVMIHIGIFLFLLAAGIAALVVFNSEAKQHIILFSALYIVLAVLLIALNRADISRRGFAVRDKDIIYRNGVIALTTTIVPFSRIQHIALHEGLFARMFGLAALNIFTAGGSSGSLHIPGIEIGEARRIKEMLMKQITKTEE
ncbi:PH domain-containing protein [Pedobacter ginsengisoli]|uniref:PH domain-containing protein n=1 Tax=Pedobacter ginsengisoli TaxID=363852 RepID=UPI002550DA60|nr:PH domain-containing protein [Pedobacter ginsengisoli]